MHTFKIAHRAVGGAFSKASRTLILSLFYSLYTRGTALLCTPLLCVREK